MGPVPGLYLHIIKYSCSIRVYQSFGINFPFASQTLPIMPALCLMLLVTYYAKNYAGMIGGSLVPGSQVPFGNTSTSTDKMFTRHTILYNNTTLHYTGMEYNIV